MRKVLAFDFGASSGRAIVGRFDGKTISLEEIHRFANEPVELNGRLYWDVLRLYHEIIQGLIKCKNAGHSDISGIAVDTWGVDYGLLDGAGRLLQNPVHYRDSRNEGLPAEVDAIIGEDVIYKRTGIQVMQINTIYQLLSSVKDGTINSAATMLFMPDLLNYFLTGEKRMEYTIASTSAMLNPFERNIEFDLLEKLKIPTNIFAPFIQPGEVCGKLLPAVAEVTALEQVPVISVGSHDTASAVISTPFTQGENSVFISSGTWSLLGIESDTPIINDKAQSFNFTNEAGGFGKTRFLKNIMGLWLVQECRAQWKKEGQNFTFDDLEHAAAKAQDFVSFVDTNDEAFLSPGDMPRRIAKYCADTNQPEPSNKGEFIKCAMQSLAFKYREVIEDLETLLDKPIDSIHIVGGGIKDTLLCQYTANATGKTVHAGPIEATAIGNVAMQLYALGDVNSLAQIREIVRDSFPLTTYLPQDQPHWNKGYEKYKHSISR